MWTFAFVVASAPYDARAALPDVCGASSAVARQKRLLIWLRGQLGVHDIPAFGPHADEEGWSLTVNAEDGLVFIHIDLEADGRPLQARIDYVGAAEVEADDTAFAVEAILAACPAVRLVEAA